MATDGARTRSPRPTDGLGDFAHGFLDATVRSCPVVLIVVYDTRKRVAASEGDVLGIVSLGCLMQNISLTAESLEIGMQVMSVFGAEDVEEELGLSRQRHRWLGRP
ncbi:MAG: nitroreductase family protein [Solirubrobacteraceae bacterium]